MGVPTQRTDFCSWGAGHGDNSGLDYGMEVGALASEEDWGRRVHNQPLPVMGTVVCSRGCKPDS